MIEQLARRALSVAWWILLPPFMLLIGRFAYERACMNPYELLQPVMRTQAGALAVAGVYVGAYVWVVVAGVLTARAASRSTLRAAWSSVWGTESFKVVTMAGALALEQVPRALWAWIYRC